ncbi:MAG: hypothetical protein HOP34_08125 [Methylococcaceae bacterium]|nr:hypothetical protein [Methylococcaceae bacterium]
MNYLLLGLCLVLIGCGEQAPQPPSVKPEALKSQLETLDQAKQIDSLLQNAADAQQQKINAQTGQ